MLTRGQIDLIQRSFAQVAPVAEQAGALFYDKLFERDPTISQLFHVDMAAQSRRLMQMIGDAVALLDQPGTLDRALAALGQRHAGYGVRDDHYATVGGALLDTLSAALGEGFTPAMREAWSAMYGHVMRTMQKGAKLTPAAA